MLPIVFAAQEVARKSILSLHPLDAIMIVAYFLLVLGIGLYLKRFAKTGEEFFMAGRGMTAWIAGLAFISTNLGSQETIGYSSTTYQYGMVMNHAYWIGAIPAILFLSIVMMPFYHICRTHSVPGYLKLRFGEAPRGLAGISFAFITILMSGINMFGMAKIMEVILGWDLHFSIWVSSITVAVYVMAGGLLSAIFNEVLQFFLIWFGCLIIPILGLIEAGGWDGLVAKIAERFSSQDFTSMWSCMGDPAANPVGMHWFAIVFGWGLAISFGYWTTDFLVVQRVMAAKDVRSAQMGTIIGGVFKMCVPLIVILPGLLGLAFLPPLVAENDPAARQAGVHTYNAVLPLMLQRYCGPGLLGLGVVSLIAGFMSGMAGNVSAFATVWTYDIYKPFIRKQATDAHYVRMGRWCTLLGVFVSIATAYVTLEFETIMSYAQLLFVMFVVPLFVPVILGMLWKRTTTPGAFWGLLAGIVISLGMFLWVHWDPNGFTGLRPDDVRNPTAVMAKIQQGANAATTYLRANLSPVTVKLFETAPAYLRGERPPEAEKLFTTKGEPDSPDEVQSKLRLAATWELNRAIKTANSGDPLYMPARFPAASLPPGATDLVGAEPVGIADRQRLQRMLIEGALTGLLTPLAESRRFDLAEFNPVHVTHVTFSEHSRDIATNVWMAFWTFLATLVVAVGLSLVTSPKPDGELKNLVYGLTTIPSQEHLPLLRRPVFWAVVVFIVFVVLNIVFWGGSKP